MRANISPEQAMAAGRIWRMLKLVTCSYAFVWAVNWFMQPAYPSSACDWCTASWSLYNTNVKTFTRIHDSASREWVMACPERNLLPAPHQPSCIPC